MLNSAPTELFYLRTLAKNRDDQDLTVGYGWFWVIPEEAFTPKILAHLGMSLETFKRVFWVYIDNFETLWTWRHQDGSLFVYDGNTNTVTKDGKTFKPSRQKMYTNYYWVTINGFLAEPNLITLMKRYQQSDPIPDEWDGAFLHSSGIAKLYADLGVSSFEEIFPTEADYDKFRFERRRFEENIRNNPDLPYQFEVNGQVIYLLDRDENGKPLFSELPKRMVQELAVAIENRKNPVGKLLVHKDLFKMIVSGDLKGKELIRACNTSKEVNDRCNANDYALFKERLREEFNLDYDKEPEGFDNARQLYIHFHSVFHAINNPNRERYDHPNWPGNNVA